MVMFCVFTKRLSLEVGGLPFTFFQAVWIMPERAGNRGGPY